LIDFWRACHHGLRKAYSDKVSEPRDVYMGLMNIRRSVL